MRVLSCASIAFAADERPPRTLVGPGACPFECCTYREWSVKADTTLVAHPDRRAPAVGKACKGSRVQGLTGIVITTKPGEIEVIVRIANDVDSLKVGYSVWSTPKWARASSRAVEARPRAVRRRRRDPRVSSAPRRVVAIGHGGATLGVARPGPCQVARWSAGDFAPVHPSSPSLVQTSRPSC